MKKCFPPFCARLKTLRGDEQQGVFASKIGLNQGTYSRYETGDREPNLEILCQIAMSCGVTSDWLLGLSESRSSATHVTATGGSAVASASPGARVSASIPSRTPPAATPQEISRLLGIIESQQRVIENFSKLAK